MHHKILEDYQEYMTWTSSTLKVDIINVTSYENKTVVFYRDSKPLNFKLKGE